jgi:hypothetical protein
MLGDAEVIEAAWLTIGEVAALLKVSTRTVQRLTSPASGAHARTKVTGLAGAFDLPKPVVV